MLSTIHWILLCGASLAAAQGPPEIPLPSWHDTLPQAAKEVFAKTDRLEILAIQPEKKPDGKEPGAKTEERLYGHKILGKASVTDKEMRTKLLAAVEKAVSDCNVLEKAQCFIPHHALRATANKKTVELVICFRCRRIAVYVDQKYLKTVGTKDTPRALLDQLLKKAGAPSPPKTPEKK